VPLQPSTKVTFEQEDLGGHDPTNSNCGKQKQEHKIPRLSRKSGSEDLFSASIRTPARYGDFDERTCSSTDIETSAVHSGDNGRLLAPLFSHVFTS